MGTNGSKPRDPLDETKAAIGELEGSSWEEEEREITETHVHVAPGAIVNVGDTGKHRAVQVTRPDNDKPSTIPPSKRGGVFGFVLALVDRIPAYQRGLVVVALAGLYAWKSGAFSAMVEAFK
jgi:hypothetical protein